MAAMTVYISGMAGKHKVLQNFTARDGWGREFEAWPKQEAGTRAPVDANQG